MMFSSNAFPFVLVLAAACNAVISVTGETNVSLGSAGDYVILAKTGISTVPDSAITGDIGVSPITGLAMTGFSFSIASDEHGETFSTSTQLTGQAFAADYGGATETKLTTAVLDMEAAYTDAAGRLNPDAARINLGAGILGVAGGAIDPLTPGVYTFGTGVTITSDIYFDGSDTDIFIIQIAGNLVQAANKNVILQGGALAKNIIWQVAGYVSVGAGAHMEGTLLVKTAVTFVTGSSLNGRVLTQTACNLQVATITEPAADDVRRQLRGKGV
jgi:hypothetical protein